MTMAASRCSSTFQPWRLHRWGGGRRWEEEEMDGGGTEDKGDARVAGCGGGGFKEGSK